MSTDPHLDVSIVIPVFDRLELTRACVASIHRHTPPGRFEIVVVDNGSSDGTAEYLREETARGRLRVVSNPANGGFARGCNQGAAAGRGRHLLFLNNDMEVTPGWLTPLIVTLDDDPEIGAVGARLLFPDGTIQHAGVAVIDQWTGAGHLLGGRHLSYRKPADFPGASRPLRLQAVTGACLLVRAELFRRLDGFDESFWNGNEDVDLCFRIAAAGYGTVYRPESVVIHYESQSGTQRWSRVRENMALLDRRWRGRVVPDFVETPEQVAESHPDASTPAPYVPPRWRRREQPPAAAGSTAAATAMAAATAAATAPAAAAAPAAATATATAAAAPAAVDAVAGPAATVIVLAGSPGAQVSLPDPRAAGAAAQWLVVPRDDTAAAREDCARLARAGSGTVAVAPTPPATGLAAAVNAALARSHGRHVALLDARTCPQPGWLAAMLAATADPSTGIVGHGSNGGGPGRALILPPVLLLVTARALARAGGWQPGLDDAAAGVADLCLRATVAGLGVVTTPAAATTPVPGADVATAAAWRQLCDLWELPPGARGPGAMAHSPVLAGGYHPALHFVPVLDAAAWEPVPAADGELHDWLDTGETLFASGRLRTAERLFTAVLRHRPRWSRAASNLAVCRWRSGDAASAEELLLSVLAREPAAADALWNLEQIRAGAAAGPTAAPEAAPEAAPGAAPA
ncbi:MAG: glycosyltransferase [Candidatus Krumholzibacteriia bacterium]